MTKREALLRLLNKRASRRTKGIYIRLCLKRGLEQTPSPRSVAEPEGRAPPRESARRTESRRSFFGAPSPPRPALTRVASRPASPARRPPCTPSSGAGLCALRFRRLAGRSPACPRSLAAPQLRFVI